METTICFLNDKILVLTGKIKGNKIYIKNYKTFELQEGSIINGIITDIYSIKNALKEIKADKKLYCKNLRIIIDSNQVYIKKSVAPRMSLKKMEIFVENEFVGFETKDSDMMFDYSIIGKNSTGKGVDAICYAVEKSFIKSFIDLFKEERMSINSIDVSTNCVSKYTSVIESLSEKTYVVTNIDGNNISLYLFVNNIYYYSTRARLLSEIDNEDYYQEISSHISSIIQFNKSQRNGYEITELIMCGLTEEQNSFCNRYLSDLGIVNSFSSAFNSMVSFKKKLQPIDATKYLYNIGSLIRK